ncbi:FkbM family methyltransferase [Rhizobium sp. Root482]|uniref:FkbM family methyltransferase n=1 Tax=Rhizobium sp. Root482 TaxID=1736543 RepID=UPI0006F3CD45|nr:FkbM family methyltransferase [Rhizobium sp. Root482]KQY12332.1 hypothetical protein ASD31_17395 [Rhizobium sp. Root482]
MKRAPLAAAIKNWKGGDNGKDAVFRIGQVLKDRKHILPGWSPAYLANLGNIKTVVDVGVLRGTPSLYKAYPNAYLVLIEALPNYRADCEAIIKDRPGELHNVAVGSYDGEIEINFLEEAPARSSVLTHIIGGTDTRTKMAVPMRKIDTLLAGRELEGDILLKIDTEGYEMEVLKGAPEFLRKVKFVIAETSVRRRHENSYLFAELVTFMQSKGFDVFDVITATRPGPDIPGASIIDVVFLNSNINYNLQDMPEDKSAQNAPVTNAAFKISLAAEKLYDAITLSMKQPDFTDEEDNEDEGSDRKAIPNTDRDQADDENDTVDSEAAEHRRKAVLAIEAAIKDIISLRSAGS